MIFTLGFVLLLLWGEYSPMVFLAAALFGVASGATMSIGLTFVSMQGVDATQTAQISAFTQCIGYVIAAFGPTGFGYVYDALGSWTPVLACQIGLSALMAVIGLPIGRQNVKPDLI